MFRPVLALFFPEAIASDDYEDEMALQGENPSKENSEEKLSLGLRSGIENLPTNFECSGTLVIFHLPQDIRGYSVIFRVIDSYSFFNFFPFFLWCYFLSISPL